MQLREYLIELRLERRFRFIQRDDVFCFLAYERIVEIRSHFVASAVDFLDGVEEEYLHLRHRRDGFRSVHQLCKILLGAFLRISFHIGEQFLLRVRKRSGIGYLHVLDDIPYDEFLSFRSAELHVLDVDRLIDGEHHLLSEKRSHIALVLLLLVLFFVVIRGNLSVAVEVAQEFQDVLGIDHARRFFFRFLSLVSCHLQCIVPFLDGHGDIALGLDERCEGIEISPWRSREYFGYLSDFEIHPSFFLVGERLVFDKLFDGFPEIRLFG